MGLGRNYCCVWSIAGFAGFSGDFARVCTAAIFFFAHSGAASSLGTPLPRPEACRGLLIRVPVRPQTLDHLCDS